MKTYGIYLIFGAVFGFVLSRVGATRYDVISDMFTFDNLQLIWVIGTAFALNLILFQILRRSGVKGPGGATLNLPQRVFQRGTIPGAALFGVGWAVTGVCPGTVVAQLGEGRLASLAIIAGIAAGAAIYPFVHDRILRWPGASSCSE